MPIPMHHPRSNRSHRCWCFAQSQSFADWPRLEPTFALCCNLHAVFVCAFLCLALASLICFLRCARPKRRHRDFPCLPFRFRPIGCHTTRDITHCRPLLSSVATPLPVIQLSRRPLSTSLLFH